MAQLAQGRFLAVVGPSGCGKSSLVRTGMLAGLAGGMLAEAGAHWRIADLRPGSRPFANLAAALLAEPRIGGDYSRHFEGPDEAAGFLQADLRRSPLGLVEVLAQCAPLAPGPSQNADAQAMDAKLPVGDSSPTQVEPPTDQPDNLLVLVDQFEEIFRYHRQVGGADESAAFVALLLASAAAPVGRRPRQTPIPVYVCFTMRSDFLGDCALFEGLPEVINRGLFLTPRLTREQTQEAIEGPTEVFDARVDTALTARLLNNMGEQADQLPVLQHALMRIWDLVTRLDAAPHCVRLTLGQYESIGGLSGALSHYADEAFNGLDPTGQRINETLFRALCERGPDGRYVRRPVTLGEVAQLVADDLGLMSLLGSTPRINPASPITRRSSPWLRPSALPGGVSSHRRSLGL